MPGFCLTPGCEFSGHSEGLCSAHFRARIASLSAAELAARSAAARAAREAAAPAIEAAVRRAFPILTDDEEVRREAAGFASVESVEASVTAATAEVARHRAAREAYDASLRARGLAIVGIKGAGNCLFGAVAHQVYGDEELHALVRAACCDYLAARDARERRAAAEGADAGADAGAKPLGAEHEVRLEGGVEAYLAHMRNDGSADSDELNPDGTRKKRPACWGDLVCLRALADMYGRGAVVWVASADGGAMQSIDTPAPLEPGAPALELANYTGHAHFDSLESEGTLAHRIPRERAGSVERAAIARLAGADEEPPSSPHGLGGTSVAQHVRTELIRGLSGGAS